MSRGSWCGTLIGQEEATLDCYYLELVIINSILADDLFLNDQWLQGRGIKGQKKLFKCSHHELMKDRLASQACLLGKHPSQYFSDHVAGSPPCCSCFSRLRSCQLDLSSHSISVRHWGAARTWAAFRIYGKMMSGICLWPSESLSHNA